MLEKTYDAAGVEPRIAARWDEAKAFAMGAGADDGADAFTIVIPPPNVTGSLHMGHALNNTLQDILVRWKRMLGYNVLWQPGMDHAGIATQMVVERKLAETQQPSRREMGRETFIEKVWEWKEESGGTIFNQLKRLGASCDWSRERFTMDEGLSKAVVEVFVKLYDEGLIYRGKRLVNWDPHFETAISDLEVENIETNGHMWHFKYPLAGGQTYDYVEKDEDGNETLRETRDYISIATTRPETMLGDGAVAVHPSDERYAPIIGKLCEIPVGPKEHRRLIPIITDEYPDKNFGSGAVKITGAHDFNDYQVAKRGGIPMYRLMDTVAAMRADGAPYAEEAAKAAAIVESGETPDENFVDAINLVPEEYRGLDRYDAREKVIADITAEGLAIMVPETDPRLGPVKAPLAPEEGGEVRALVPLVEKNKMQQPTGDRSKVVIEPMLTDQWFCDAETLAKPATAAVREGRTDFVPKTWENTYFNWMDNIQPWCISRQLWWGHRIPVWYGVSKEAIKKYYADCWERDQEDGLTIPRDRKVSMFSNPSDHVSFCARTVEEAREKASEYYSELGVVHVSVPEDTPSDMSVQPSSKSNMPSCGRWLDDDDDTVLWNVDLYRDPDVLDTWFSSALWPFSTLGWPDETPELASHYQTDVLVTGFDIIFFWVARMMMMGLHFMKDEDGKPVEPFHTVYVHALVRDKTGAKMSKSKGNVIDPLELMDEYGTDALRFTLAIMAAQGRDVKLDTARIAGYRNFGTKLWNATRFAQMNEVAPVQGFDPASATHQLNRWVLTELSATITEIDDALEKYRFNDASAAAYRFVWNTFCDWYLELLKPVFNGDDEAAKTEARATAAHVLGEIYRLLHPFMPFITEELATETGMLGEGELLCHSAWPKAGVSDTEAAGEINWLIDLVTQIRSLRSEINIKPSQQLPLVVIGADEATKARIARHQGAIERLARVDAVSHADAAPKGSAQLIAGSATVAVPLQGLVDVAAESARLNKEIAGLDKDIKQIGGKLKNEKFVANAPEAIVEENRQRLVDAEERKQKLSAALTLLSAL
ncbi:valine--tRNA ligase [Ahrensia sp. R2A130]|uniref:valine--tRNA ligase n=1 Tax=Ahrensia sp. R2A130 TaxID=744979 RepID=UPI0001E093F8|nr:valine--tRNA ligase [Ahrensia sp. R2A130]EFL89975.1 valyl-tRNA synthetase [Ahrensia sp. R2A130]